MSFVIMIFTDKFKKKTVIRNEKEIDLSYSVGEAWFNFEHISKNTLGYCFMIGCNLITYH